MGIPALTDDMRRRLLADLLRGVLEDEHVERRLFELADRLQDYVNRDGWEVFRQYEETANLWRAHTAERAYLLGLEHGAKGVSLANLLLTARRQDGEEGGRL